jgi:hypothetical protein
MKFGHNGHLNTRNKFKKRFSPNPKFSLLILDKPKESRFWRKQGKSTKSKGLEPWIYSMVGGR